MKRRQRKYAQHNQLISFIIGLASNFFFVVAAAAVVSEKEKCSDAYRPIRSDYSGRLQAVSFVRQRCRIPACPLFLFRCITPANRRLSLRATRLSPATKISRWLDVTGEYFWLRQKRPPSPPGWDLRNFLSTFLGRGTSSSTCDKLSGQWMRAAVTRVGASARKSSA